MTEYKEKTKHTLSLIWSFFIEKRPIAWLTIITLTILGLNSLSNLPLEIQPEVKIPYVSVVAALPGANPSDVESLLTESLEKEISTVPNIKTMSSSSGFGYVSIFLEFETSADIDTSLQKVKDTVAKAKSSFPKDALEPSVQKAEMNQISVITLSIIGELPLYELTKITEDAKAQLEKIDGVSSVEMSGDQKKYIEVTLSQQKLEEYKLSIQQVSDIIQYANNNIPVGIISLDKLNYSVRIDNRYTSLEDIRNIPLFSATDENKTIILLRDIAKVEETLPPQTIITKVSENGDLSLEAISLQVYKKIDSNIVQIAEDAKAKIEELKNDNTIPQDVRIVITNDNSVFVSEELNNLIKNGYETMALILIILFLAFSLTQGIISGLAVPIIFLIAFIIMDWQGISINTLSLFSLVMALGMIVDDMIVIMEGIHTNIKKHGLDPVQAALLSVDTYKWPLIAGTLTTVFAFMPMLLVSGIIGEFLKTLPITMTAALLASLFVALTLVPSITSKYLKTDTKKEKTPVLEPFFRKAGNALSGLIAIILKRKIFRFLTILIPLIAFALSLSLPITGILKVELFPQTDQNYFIVDVEAEKGLTIDETEKIVKDVENYLYTVPEIKNFLTRIGTSASVAMTKDSMFGGGATTNSNIANITVNLINKDERERKSYDIAKEIRDNFKNFSKANVVIQEIKEGPPGEAAITIRVTGKDFEVLNDLAKQVKQIVESVPYTTNVDLNLESGLNEFKFVLDKDALSYHGLQSIQVSALIRNIIQGVKATTIKLNGDDIDVVVKYDLNKENNRTNISINDIENFKIASPFGYLVSLAELGSYTLEQSLASIERENEKRIIKVISDIEQGTNSVDIYAQIEEKLKSLKIPNGYEINFGGDLEAINDSFKELFNTMAIGLILIAFILILEFNSFKQPLIILFTLPLALIAVFPGLLILGLNFSFPAFLGIVALAGVVVKNAIVLLDRINNSRKAGMKFEAAVAEATKARFEPIFMTSITTVIGVIPLALSNEFWAGIGFSLAFGLSCSTMLTLVIIPVTYYSFEYRKGGNIAGPAMGR